GTANASAVYILGLRTDQDLHRMLFSKSVGVGQCIGPQGGAVVLRIFIKSIQTRVRLDVVIVIIGKMIRILIGDRTAKARPDREMLQEIHFSKYIADHIPLVILVVGRPLKVCDGVMTVA